MVSSSFEGLGLTEMGADEFSYACPRTTVVAIEEMIAPQGKSLEVPERGHSDFNGLEFKRDMTFYSVIYGITMLADLRLDIEFVDLAAKGR